MKVYLAFLSLLLPIVLLKPLYAQTGEQEPPSYRIEMTDGNVLTGKIIYTTNDSITLRTATIGDISFLSANILRKTPIYEFEQELRRETFHANRYFMMNNNLGIPRGSVFYQNAWFGVNKAYFGITNRFSIGGGLVPFFVFGAHGPVLPAWIVPAVNFPVIDNMLSLGANIQLGTITSSPINYVGLMTISGTLGNRNNNLTLGFGYGFGHFDYEDAFTVYSRFNWAQGPKFSLSGMVRTGPRHFLMTENYYKQITEDLDAFISFLGGRAVIRRITLDYGLFFQLYRDYDFAAGLALPWLSIAIPFDRR